MLREKLEELPEARKLEIPSLGYRGFIIQPEGMISSLPYRIRVFNGVVQSLLTKDGPTVYNSDAKGLEEWFISQAREHKYGDVIDAALEYVPR